LFIWLLWALLFIKTTWSYVTLTTLNRLLKLCSKVLRKTPMLQVSGCWWLCVLLTKISAFSSFHSVFFTFSSFQQRRAMVFLWLYMFSLFFQWPSLRLLRHICFIHDDILLTLYIFWIKIYWFIRADFWNNSLHFVACKHVLYIQIRMMLVFFVKLHFNFAFNQHDHKGSFSQEHIQDAENEETSIKKWNQVVWKNHWVF